MELEVCFCGSRMLGRLGFGTLGFRVWAVRGPAVATFEDTVYDLIKLRSPSYSVPKILGQNMAAHWGIVGSGITASGTRRSHNLPLTQPEGRENAGPEQGVQGVRLHHGFRGTGTAVLRGLSDIKSTIVDQSLAYSYLPKIDGNLVVWRPSDCP